MFKEIRKHDDQRLSKTKLYIYILFTLFLQKRPMLKKVKKRHFFQIMSVFSGCQQVNNKNQTFGLMRLG